MIETVQSTKELFLMANLHSCIIHEFPIPEREYRAAPPAQWDKPASRPRRPAPSRLKRRRKRNSPLLILAAAGLGLFIWGFLLGRSAAGDEPSLLACALSQQFALLPEDREEGESGSSDLFTLLPEEPEQTGTAPVRIVPGAVIVEGDERAAGSDGVQEDWRLLLVNRDHALPEGFQVPQLTQLRNSQAIDSRVYPDLQRMMDAARAEGLDPLICSSYRSWDKQTELFERKVQSCMKEAGSRAEAEDLAAKWVSRPGTSEHQAGLAVDIVDKSYQLLDEKQEETAVQKWLMAHCAEYGFILRYPTSKSAVTGVGYEPWHYRYVGVEAAGEIMSRGLCLEEYEGAD